uniref:Uncharacterized protein n=1 Tax=Nelumbo nucifera TaxID=4432 RepID=A0A822YUQ2_NELNU|nr:TPA_asm: hypothetical protein HUJ06_008455 [Nelumbo nucifera]
MVEGDSKVTMVWLTKKKIKTCLWMCRHVLREIEEWVDEHKLHTV